MKMGGKALAVATVVVGVLLIFSYGSGGGSGATTGKYPEGYPKGYREWTHIKSMVIQEGHALYDSFGGIHHIYANKDALSGYRSKKKKFSDGSVIVFDLLDARAEDHTITEGSRKLIGVMVKNKAKYASTGGWGFFAFKGSTTEPLKINPADCFSCHQSAAESDYVFSQFRE
ncbi:MAG: cytochrome P460 family protein [bacterium JZ-2024 1]